MLKKKYYDLTLERLLFLFEKGRIFITDYFDGFDKKFGTDTANPFFGSEHDLKSYFYVPTPVHLIYDIINSIPRDVRDFTFVDMGSGKGRTLLVASEFPFKKIIGVEISETLHNTAKTNIRLFDSASQKCTNISLEILNAVDYKFGCDPIILFLYNPFGPDILKQVLDNLEKSLINCKYDVFVVYVYPKYEKILNNFNFLHILKKHTHRWKSWNNYIIYATSSV